MKYLAIILALVGSLFVAETADATGLRARLRNRQRVQRVQVVEVQKVRVAPVKVVERVIVDDHHNNVERVIVRQRIRVY